MDKGIVVLKRFHSSRAAFCVFNRGLIRPTPQETVGESLAAAMVPPATARPPGVAHPFGMYHALTLLVPPGRATLHNVDRLSESLHAREESPPPVRAGDRTQVRSGRPLALEQKRHVSARPMMRANPTERKGVDPQREGGSERLWRENRREASGDSREPRVAAYRSRFESADHARRDRPPLLAEDRWNGESSPVQVRAVVARTPAASPRTARTLSRMPGRTEGAYSSHPVSPSRGYAGSRQSGSSVLTARADPVLPHRRLLRIASRSGGAIGAASAPPGSPRRTPSLRYPALLRHPASL